MKSKIKRILARTPYSIIRNRGRNRFEYIAGALENLRSLGYAPRRVIDGGAHAGDFSRAASRIFPHARFELVEPQPACAATLRELAGNTRFTFHPLALGAADAPLHLLASNKPSTGARLGERGEGAVEVHGTRLDTLFRDLRQDERALLKLDLQGHELEALKGAEAILPVIEVILAEVSFFGVAGAPTIPDLFSFLQDQHFCPFDVAALGARFRDNRLRQGDFLFVREDSVLLAQSGWD